MKSYPIPANMYLAVMKCQFKKWVIWYKANGFTFDENSNLLAKDSELWRIDSDAKSLITN